jgi:hypothetical protein
MSNHFRVHPFLSMIAICAGAILCGCASQPGDLRMTGIANHRNFRQNFDRAYISKDEAGDADIVLVQDGFASRDDNASTPMAPDNQYTPRQLVHIRIFWNPMTGAQADHPANTNASLHWCLMGDGADHGGMLEYAGSGVVLMDRGHNGTNLTIRKAWMKAISQRGNMLDPLGPSLLIGSIYAVDDDQKVQSLLAELKSAVAPDQQGQAAASDAATPKPMAINP